MKSVRSGSFASCTPRVMHLQGAIPFRSAEGEGVEIGVFAWVNLDTGTVDNMRQRATDQIGIVLPVVDGRAASFLEELIPPECEVRMAVKGDFYIRFPKGAVAGEVVYARMLDGTPTSGETPDAQATPWYVVTDCAPGGLAIISTWR